MASKSSSSPVHDAIVRALGVDSATVQHLMAELVVQEAQLQATLEDLESTGWVYPRERGAVTLWDLTERGRLAFDRRVPWDRATAEFTVPVRHNHVTRNFLPRGRCPGCDAYYDKHGEMDVSAPSGLV